MTAQEIEQQSERIRKELTLADAGFRKVWPLHRRFFLWLNNYKPIKNIWFMKGVTKRKEISTMNITMQGTLAHERILLEIDGILWVKNLKEWRKY